MNLAFFGTFPLKVFANPYAAKAVFLCKWCHLPSWKCIPDGLSDCCILWALQRRIILKRYFRPYAVCLLQLAYTAQSFMPFSGSAREIQAFPLYSVWTKCVCLTVSLPQDLRSWPEYWILCSKKELPNQCIPAYPALYSDPHDQSPSKSNPRGTPLDLPVHVS